MTDILIRREILDIETDRHKGKIMEAEIGIMLPQTKECLELPETEEGKLRAFSHRFQRKHSPVSSLILDFWSSEL